jgi:hypothetical protein
MAGSEIVGCKFEGVRRLVRVDDYSSDDLITFQSAEKEAEVRKQILDVPILNRS